MMDPKKYDKLIEQEDHFREKYNVEIFLKLSTAPDSKDSTGKKLHSAIMTVTGDSYIVRSSPSFRSDENGAFYRQIDAMVNARIKLVDWFKVGYHHPNLWLKYDKLPVLTLACVGNG